MLRIATHNLPRDRQKLLHPDFLANEQSYLRMRVGLLSQYRGQWVAVENDQVVFAGVKLMEVIEQATTSGRRPSIGFVAGEDDVVFRVRREVTSYDTSYQPFAMPRVSANFANDTFTHALRFTDVIPDTGADVSVLPDADCAAIDLY